MAFRTTRHWCWREGPRWAAAVLFVAAVAVLYVGAERTIYFWDAALYQTLVADTGAAFARSWRDGVAGVARSLSDDYNQLFAVPLVPIAKAAARSRTVYVAAIALLYHLPMALVLGALVAALVREDQRRVAWSATALVLAIPTIWAPTLRGLPDAGAAAFYYGALLAYVRRIEGGRLRVALVAGACMAASALFRRHFAYAALVFYVAAVLHLPALVYGSDGVPWPDRLRRATTTLAVMGLGSALILSTIGLPFLRHTFAADYYTLYRSYLQPPVQELHAFLVFYGTALWTLSAIGWAAAARLGVLRAGPASFVALTGVGGLALWAGYVRQWGPQYGFHVTPLLVAGLVALGAVVQRGLRAPWGRAAVAATAALFLVVNAWHSFGARSPVSVRAIKRVLADRYPPATRPDYDEVFRLAAYLRAIAAPGDAIFVIGSSETINWNVLAQADAMSRPPGAAPLAIDVAPQVDSRDWAPIEDLLRAQVVVVATPFQHHLALAEQDVVRVAGEVFTNGWELARDFDRRPDLFTLRDGVTVAVYVRRRPTATAAALRFVGAMAHEFEAETLGTPRPWLALGRFAAGTPPGPVRLRLDEPQVLLDITHSLVSGQWSGSVRSLSAAGVGLRVSLFVAAPDGTIAPTPAVSVSVRALPAGTPVELHAGTPDATRPWWLLVIAAEEPRHAPVVEVTRLAVVGTAGTRP